MVGAACCTGATVALPTGIRGERGQFRRILANAVGSAARHAIVNLQVLADCPTQRTQTLLQHPVACLCLRIARLKGIEHADAPLGLLRPRGKRPGRRAAKNRDELAAFYLIELHSISNSPRGMQDIELAMVSQRVYDHALARARAR
jgi:hypothetical protein